MRWVRVADARALRRGPLAVEAEGLFLVLFRGPDRRPRALEDRCPHRGVPLSQGRCVGGTIACVYHGWRFGGDGGLLEVPSSVAGTPLPRVEVPAYACEEREGGIWVGV